MEESNEKQPEAASQEDAPPAPLPEFVDAKERTWRPRIDYRAASEFWKEFPRVSWFTLLFEQMSLPLEAFVGLAWWSCAEQARRARVEREDFAGAVFGCLGDVAKALRAAADETLNRKEVEKAKTPLAR